MTQQSSSQQSFDDAMTSLGDIMSQAQGAIAAADREITADITGVDPSNLGIAVGAPVGALVGVGVAAGMAVLGWGGVSGYAGLSAGAVTTAVVSKEITVNTPAITDLIAGTTALNVTSQGMVANQTLAGWGAIGSAIGAAASAVGDFFGAVANAISEAVDSSGYPADPIDGSDPSDPGPGTGTGAPNNPGEITNDPLILNLAGGQVHTVSATLSGATFDAFGDGTPVATGWTTSGEGFLALPSADGTISSAQSLIASFSALAQYDLNGDGVINSGDAIYSQLRVWENSAGDGAFRASDLYSLSQLGIASINLGSTVVDRYDNGNVIADDGSFTYANGSTGDIAQAVLVSGSAAAAATITTDTNSLTVGAGGGPATQFITGTGQTVTLQNNGVGLYVDVGGNNTIDASGVSDAMVIVNNGSTLDLTGAQNMTVIAGGHVQIIGGAGGNNTIYIEGDSSAFTAGSGGVTLTVDGNGSVLSTAAQNSGQAVSVINRSYSRHGSDSLAGVA